jgi:hypothetical protein
MRGDDVSCRVVLRVIVFSGRRFCSVLTVNGAGDFKTYFHSLSTSDAISIQRGMRNEELSEKA